MDSRPLTFLLVESIMSHDVECQIADESPLAAAHRPIAKTNPLQTYFNER